MSEAKALAPMTGSDDLLRVAVERGADVDTLERLLALRERVQAENARRAFQDALASFQSECPAIERTRKGGHGKYAPLEEMARVANPVLSKHGFSYTFETEETPDAVVTWCILRHRDGHCERSPATIPKLTRDEAGRTNSAQAIGSVMSYGRRYSLQNATGLVVKDEDDDGGPPARNPRRYGSWETPDRSFQPPLDYALRVLSPTIEHVIQAVRDKDYSSALEAYNELTKGEMLALKVAPSKGGPWPQDVWNSMQSGGAFRLYAEEQARIKRAEQQVNAHDTEQ